MNKNERLQYITHKFVKDLLISKFRGVTAEWREETLYIAFYFDGDFSENDQEEAEVSSTEIIAQYPDGFLDEQFIRWDRPKELPRSEHWALKRD